MRKWQPNLKQMENPEGKPAKNTQKPEEEAKYPTRAFSGVMKNYQIIENNPNIVPFPINSTGSYRLFSFPRNPPQVPFFAPIIQPFPFSQPPLYNSFLPRPPFIISSPPRLSPATIPIISQIPSSQKSLDSTIKILIYFNRIS